MARAIPAWLHRVLLRDHGPPDPWMKLVLFTVNSFMNDSGSCYPSQDAIAAAAGMGVSTVRRKLADASRAHWLALETRSARYDRGWRQYRYRASAPDSIVASFVPDTGGPTGEALADAWEAEHGQIHPESVIGTMFPQSGQRRAPLAPSGTDIDRPPAPSGSHAVAPPVASGSHVDPPLAASGVDVSGTRAPPADDTSTARSRVEHRPLTTRAPPAAACEVFSESKNRRSVPGEGALTRARPNADSDREAEIGKAERLDTAIKAMPSADDDTIRCMVAGATLADVSDARRRARQTP